MIWRFWGHWWGQAGWQHPKRWCRTKRKFRVSTCFWRLKVMVRGSKQWWERFHYEGGGRLFRKSRTSNFNGTDTTTHGTHLQLSKNGKIHWGLSEHSKPCKLVARKLHWNSGLIKSGSHTPNKATTRPPCPKGCCCQCSSRLSRP